MSFGYIAHPNNLGFGYEDPLPSDVFSNLLLHSRTPDNKPFLTNYISDEIMEFMNPPLVIPQFNKIMTLTSFNTIDPNSPIFKCGYLIMNSDGIVDKSCAAFKDGYATVKSDGKFDKKCQAYTDALIKYIKQLKKKKEKQMEKKKEKQMEKKGNFMDEPYLICYDDGTVFPFSKYVLNGEVLLTKEHKIDKRGIHYKNGNILLTKDDKIDKRCKWCKQGKIIIIIL